MLKVTRLADYAVSIITCFSGTQDEMLSSQDIIGKTRLKQATVNKILSVNPDLIIIGLTILLITLMLTQ